MSYPFFSVVIPTYNRAAFILKTLESVLAQTYPHFEIIVVDNCSTDDTAELLEPFIRGGQIRFIRHDRNYERSRSRNTGMEAAKGDFVTLLDSDDIMYPTCLEEAARYVQANPDIKCFHSLAEIIDESGHVVYRIPYPSLKNRFKAIVEGNFMSCIGDFIHQDIYHRYRFDTDPCMPGLEDWDFWLRVFADYEVGRLEKVTSGIVQHGGRSVNQQDIERLQIGFARMLGNIGGDEHLYSIYGLSMRRLRATCHLYLATLSNSGRVHGSALKFLVRAAATDWRVITTKRFVRLLQIALFRMDTTPVREKKLQPSPNPGPVDGVARSS
jgi:glycosyltransferase involved in cell wall biosynthesis